jgi:hypothetical protein
MRKACSYRGENHGPGKDVQRELELRPGIRELLGIPFVYLTARGRWLPTFMLDLFLPSLEANDILSFLPVKT